MVIVIYVAFFSVLPVVLSSSAPSQAALSIGASLSVEEDDKAFLVSPNHTFSCGFYKGGKNAFYFSIWFTNTIDKTVIWTANPGVPVNGHGSKISFNSDGSLILRDVGGSIVWESKISLGKGSTVHLLETGNLVIKDSNHGVVWESFDSPTDTLLPLQHLTKNKKLVSNYYSLYYDNDNVLRLMYDGPEVSSIYWPNPDNGIYQNGRTNYNSSRIAVLDKMGRFVSSDGLNIVASDFETVVWRRLMITQDGNRLTGRGVCYTKSLLFNGRRSPSFLGSFYLKISTNGSLSVILAPKQTRLTCRTWPSLPETGARRRD